MRLIARALEINVATSDLADRLVTAFELAAGFTGVFGGLGVRRVMFNSGLCELGMSMTDSAALFFGG